MTRRTHVKRKYMREMRTLSHQVVTGQVIIYYENDKPWICNVGQFKRILSKHGVAFNNPSIQAWYNANHDASVPFLFVYADTNQILGRVDP